MKNDKKLIITNRKKFPSSIKEFDFIKGICIGKCIAGDHFDEAAHAHCHKGYEHTGWICLSHKKQLREKYLLLHEVAHLIANTSEKIPNHGKQWQDTVVNIGGIINPHTAIGSNQYTNFWYAGYTKRGQLYYP